MKKLSSDTGYFKNPVEINRGFGHLITVPIQQINGISGCIFGEKNQIIETAVRTLKLA